MNQLRYSILVSKLPLKRCADNNKASISYLPTMSLMASTPGSLYPIDIHPSEIGYRVIAQEFLKQIEPTILKNK
jgi:hypothetical protein